MASKINEIHRQINSVSYQLRNFQVVAYQPRRMHTDAKAGTDALFAVPIRQVSIPGCAGNHLTLTDFDHTLPATVAAGANEE